MTPFVSELIDCVADEFGVAPALITKRCTRLPVVYARREVMRRLYAAGYRSRAIGRMLNHDRTTVLFSIGKLKKKPSRMRWRKPRIAHLHCHGCRRCRLKVRRPGCLIPYAGADMSEYRWTVRP